MPIDLTDTLVVGVSTTALFDLSETDKTFRAKKEEDPDTAIEEYRKFMLDHENDELNDGTAMPLVRSLLNLNKYIEDSNVPPIVEVVIMSRNSPETGVQVLNNIRRRSLPITRSAFTAGEASTSYLDAFYVDLFLTTSEEDAQQVIDSGVCAAALVKEPPKRVEKLDENQVRFAFDADAVIFNEDSELVNQKDGLSEFWRTEDEKQDIPLNEGPYANLLKKLSKVQERLPGRVEFSPIKLAIMTARNSPAEMRVIKTLRNWGIYVDQAFFLGGLQKSRFLKAFKPHIFFDDQDAHLEPAAGDVPSAQVLYPSSSALKTVLQDKKNS